MFIFALNEFRFPFNSAFKRHQNRSPVSRLQRCHVSGTIQWLNFFCKQNHNHNHNHDHDQTQTRSWQSHRKPKYRSSLQNSGTFFWFKAGGREQLLLCVGNTRVESGWCNLLCGLWRSCGQWWCEWVSRELKNGHGSDAACPLLGCHSWHSFFFQFWTWWKLRMTWWCYRPNQDLKFFPAVLIPCLMNKLSLYHSIRPPPR